MQHDHRVEPSEFEAMATDSQMSGVDRLMEQVSEGDADAGARPPLTAVERLVRGRNHQVRDRNHQAGVTEISAVPDGLELNNKKIQVSVGIPDRVFGTIFYKYHAKFHRFRHNFVVFHLILNFCFPDI